MPALIRESTPASRGKVQCSLCWRTIPAGEQYRRTTLKYDYLYDWSECQTCGRFAREVDLHALAGWPDEGFSRDDLWEIEPTTWRQARLIALARKGWTVSGRFVGYPEDES